MANEYPKVDGSSATPENANKSIRAYVYSGCHVNEGVSASDMTVALDAGKVYVDGEFIDFSSTTQVISTADGSNPRYDFIGIKIDSSANTVTKVYVAGTPAASPTFPGPAAADEPVIPLALVYVGTSVTAITNEKITDLRPTLGGHSFVGEIRGWAKTLTGVGNLPVGWVECNGQTLNDPQSPVNGQTIPNLNASGGGTKRYLRGSTTSGTTGGADTVTLTSTELPAHTHTIAIDNTGGFGTGVVTTGGTQDDTRTTSSTGSGSAFSILNSYYEVVWVMRVRPA